MRSFSNRLNRLLLTGGCAIALTAGGAQAGDKLCPLPRADLEKSVQAFNKLAIAFHDPRCANCHGAVNPFADNGNHIGSKIGLSGTFSSLLGNRSELVSRMSEVMRNHPDPQGRTVPSNAAVELAMTGLRTYLSIDGPGATDRAIIEKVLQDAGIKELAEQANCSECHENKPKVPWGLATSLWAGLSNRQLCEFLQAKMEPPQFLEHISDDPLGFVQLGFKGTKGLKPAARQIVQEVTHKPYAVQPVKGISEGDFAKAGNDWFEALGMKFHKPPSCGCTVVNYRVELTGNVRAHMAQAGMTSDTTVTVSHTLPLVFDKSGAFRAAATDPITLHTTMTGPGLSCVMDMIADQTTEMSGTFSEGSPNIRFAFRTNGRSRPAVQICTDKDGTKRIPVPAYPFPEQTASYDITAEDGATKDLTMPFGGYGDLKMHMAVRQS